MSPLLPADDTRVSDPSQPADGPVRSVVHPSGLIPQGLVDKVVARRGGRLHVHPTLDGPRTAFVVVDMDEHSCSRAEDSELLFDPVNAVSAAVRSAGGTVAFVTTADPGPDGLAGVLGPELAAVYAAAAMPGGAATRPAAGLDVHDADLRAVKARASAFFPGNCDLPDELRAREIEHVLIGGMVTNVCCESSARDAHELGYRVTMVSDALWGQSFGLHEASLATFFRIFGDVRPSREVIELLS